MYIVYCSRITKLKYLLIAQGLKHKVQLLLQVSYLATKLENSHVFLCFTITYHFL